MSARALHLVVPRGYDDPVRPSGGNTYDRLLRDALLDRGWQVHVSEVEGGWPWRADVGAPALAEALRAVPAGADVVVDGLLASRLPGVMVPACRRLRVALLMHLPVGVDDEVARRAERDVVAAATSVVAPSAWCRDWLLDAYDVDPARVRVARPGVAPAPIAPGTPSGSSLLTVGSLAAVKGQDRLLVALDRVGDLPWHWTCVGGDVEAVFAANLRFGARCLPDRVTFTGPLDGARLETAYAGADLVVVPSRRETYGMVVAEALARGIPVLAHDVGGVREAMGGTGAGDLPGMLVRREGSADLAAALRTWLHDPDLRAALRARALERRERLVGWDRTADDVADLVRGVAA